MAKGNYYTPAAKITLVPGVEREEGLHCDQYRGTVEALHRSGILTPDLLPAPGHSSISWRPTGVERVSRCWFHVPGYMSIYWHPSGVYRVALTVSHEQQEIREERQRLDREARRRKGEQDRAAHERTAPPIRGAQTEEEFREHPRVFARVLHNVLLNGKSDGGPFSYALDDDEREAVSDALESIEAVIEQSALAVDRGRLAQVQLIQKHIAAKADAPLQLFLATVNGKPARRKPA